MGPSGRDLTGVEPREMVRRRVLSLSDRILLYIICRFISSLVVQASVLISLLL